MRVVNILPRGMHFGPKGATAIDLCVRDFVAHSAHRASTTVLAQPVSEPFEDIQYRPVEVPTGASHLTAARRFAREALALSPDIAIVHHHLPSAAAVARALFPIPVLLHRQNLQGRVNPLMRLYHRWLFVPLARTIWVSEIARQSFLAQHPTLAGQSSTVHNGLDLCAWAPVADRSRTVVCCGRATPHKGILEAAHAVTGVLSETSDWRACFILSMLDRNDAYLQQVREALAPLGSRAQVLTDQPHSIVKSAYETAAIALVPSIFPEPFGRTAIEAFAGGAALIASRTGGLPEVTGDAALQLDAVTPTAVAAALRRLVTDATLRSTLAARGRRRAEECFDIVKQSNRLDQLYADALSTSRA